MGASGGRYSSGDSTVKLIWNWKDAHKFISNRCMALVIGCNGAYRLLDPTLQAALPGWVVSGLSFGLLALGMLGTIIDQSGSSDASLSNRKTDNV